MALKILTLDGLSDAKMSELVAKLLETIDGVKEARIDFLSQKLTLDIDGRSSEAVVKDVTAVLRKNIPSVTIKRIEVGKNHPLQQRQQRPQRERVPDYSRYNYAEDDDDEEPEEDEDEPEERPKKEKKEKPPQETPEIDPVLRKFVAGFALALLCYLLYSLVFLTGIAATVSSIAAYVFAAITLLRLKPGKLQGSLAVPKLAALLTSSAIFLLGDRDIALPSLLVFLMGLFASVLFYNNLEKEVDKVVAINPEKVKRIKDGNTESVPLKQILPGDQIIIPSQSSVPFDGVVIDGGSTVDRSLLTGEEETIPVGEGSLVACGDKNLDSSITIRVIKMQEMSNAYKMRSMLYDSSLTDTGLVLEARKKIMIFSILSIAAAVFGALYLFATSEDFSWLAEAITFVMITCPYGATASVKGIQIGSVAGKMNHGIILKGGVSQENLAQVNTVITGYTGVMTRGNYEVIDVQVVDGVERKELLRLAASAEHDSLHSIANVIRELYAQERAEDDPEPDIANWEEVKGRGVRAMVDRQIVIAGSEKFMEEAGVTVPPNESGKVCVYIACRNEFIGAILLDDPLRAGTEGFAEGLRDIGVGQFGIMTGCDTAVAQAVGEELGTDSIYAEQSLLEKLNTLNIIQQERERPSQLLLIGNSEMGDLFILPCSKISVGRNAFDSLFELSDAMILSANPLKVIETIKACKRAKESLNFSVLAMALVKALLFAYTIYQGPSFLLVTVVNAACIVFLALNAARTMF